MTRSRINIHVEDGVASVRGWGSAEQLKAAGIRAVFARGAWLIDETRLPDLLAEVERRRIAVELTGGSASPSRSISPEAVPKSADVDLPLWSDGGAS